MYSKTGSIFSDIFLVIFSSAAKLLTFFIILKNTDNASGVLKSSFNAASNFTLESSSNDDTSSVSCVPSANLNS